MLIQARVVLPMSSPPVAAGAVRVHGNRVTEVGPAGVLLPETGEETVDLGDTVLLPGLINAHCHLDYSSLRHAIDPPEGFTEWVQRLNSIKRQLSSEDILEAIRKGCREARRYGTTTVCSMAAFPDLLPILEPPAIRIWWFYEMIDVRHRVTSEEVVAGALSFFNTPQGSLTRYGLNPHAPYTASLLLYRLADACAREAGLALSSHVSESVEETQMFAEQSGPLHAFLAQLGRPMHDCGHDTPLGWLWRNDAINKDWILAHLNDLRESDFSLLESLPASALPHAVHCPGSHAYFKHPRFPFERLFRMGMNICVGTDSLASTDSLSLLAELRRLKRSVPELSAEQLLDTVTRAPARALNQQGALGCIAPGALADLIGIPLRGVPLQDAASACIEYRGPVPWMMVDGTILNSQTG